MKRPLWVKLTMPLHWALTRLGVKYRCWCCEDDEEPHVGMAAVLGWFRDKNIKRRHKSFLFRQKHPRWQAIRCFFGKHHSIRMSPPPVGVCVACDRKVTTAFDDMEEE